MWTRASTRKDVVLVGGGHAHVQVLRRQLMAPLPGARLTLVVDRPVALYSGMVPGVVAGQYQRHEAEIDLRPLARRAGVRLIEAPVRGFDLDALAVLPVGRPALPFDLCSINVGSVVAGLETQGVAEQAIPTRPIGAFLDRLEARLSQLKGREEVDVAVVGAGAGGVELAFCLEARLRREGNRPRVRLIGEGELLAEQVGARSRVKAAAAERGVELLLGERVVEVEAGSVVLAGGARLPSQLTLWVVGAAPPPWLREQGLPLDQRGFVQVEDSLQVLGMSSVFAVGDCAVPRAWPQIPKAGVYAVRQGPVLADNLRASLEGRPLSTYSAQRDFLMILNLGDGSAVATRSGLSLRGPSMMRLKDWIDRRFMARFQALDPAGRPAAPFSQDLPPMEPGEMICGGCAAKLSEDPLRQALRQLPPAPPQEGVLLGLAESDDVGVIAWPGGPALVMNVDSFSAFTDDPWLVGRVAALNALSDLDAKGAQPRAVMAIVQLPLDEARPEAALVELLSGARAELDRCGVALIGGHTTLGEALSIGFAVVGSPAGPLRPQSGLQVGDRLVLTRALGTGVLWAADRQGLLPSAWAGPTIRAMLRGNATAAALLDPLGARGVTDVTGFGLARHLGSLLRASDKGGQLWLDRLPALPGAVELLGQGLRSTFHTQNEAALRAMRLGPGAAEHPRLHLLFDPQTSGGLLFGLPPDRLPAALQALREVGEDVAEVGEVTEADGALCTALVASA